MVKWLNDGDLNTFGLGEGPRVPICDPKTGSVDFKNLRKVQSFSRLEWTTHGFFSYLGTKLKNNFKVCKIWTLIVDEESNFQSTTVNGSTMLIKNLLETWVIEQNHLKQRRWPTWKLTFHKRT